MHAAPRRLRMRFPRPTPRSIRAREAPSPRRRRGARCAGSSWRTGLSSIGSSNLARMVESDSDHPLVRDQLISCQVISLFARIVPAPFLEELGSGYDRLDQVAEAVAVGRE